MAARHGTSSVGDQDMTELESLKKELHRYREVLIPINRVIEWEQSYYPAALVGGITLLFSIAWYLEPSVLTSVGLLCLCLCVVDFAVPTISAHFLQASEWTEANELQFEAICTRLLNAKTHFYNLKQNLLKLRLQKPTGYLIVMVGIFSLLAWFGSLIDNLLLTYLIVVGTVLVPGLRKHGILQKVMQLISDKIASLRSKEQPAKTKTN